MTLLMNFRDFSSFPGVVTALHLHLCVNSEKMIFMVVCFWRSPCRSSFIAETRLMLFSSPRSSPPQCIRRTSGDGLPLRHWWKNGTSPFHLRPSWPNHLTMALESSRFFPIVPEAKSCPLWT